MADLINPNPEVFERRPNTRPKKGPGEPLDATDVFEFIRDIQDPEHPYSLEQLNVVQESLVRLDHDERVCMCAACRLSLAYIKRIAHTILLLGTVLAIGVRRQRLGLALTPLSLRQRCRQR